MLPGQQVKVHKSASFVDILEVCKFTFCDRKGYKAHTVIIYTFSMWQKVYNLKYCLPFASNGNENFLVVVGCK